MLIFSQYNPSKTLKLVISSTLILLIYFTIFPNSISFQDPEEVARREKKDQIQSDEESALRFHAEEQAKFERLQKERVAQEEANRGAIYEEMDNIQAMIKADEKLAARVQAEEKELYSIEEKSRLLVEMIAERKRFFAAQRVAKQRSKPPTKSQMRNRMCTYLRDIGGYKHNQLKGKIYKDIQKLFDKTYKQVNSFVPMAADDKGKGSEKKARGSRKKTLAKKRAEDKMYYEIIRANGSTKSYKIFTKMLDDFDRHDVLDLYRLVKERFETAIPEGYDRLLWGDLITVIHVLLMDTGIAIHMLVEKTYPLTQEMLSRILSRKLEVDNESEMAFELLRFTRSQIEK
ncbi:hypothetical protein Tco_0972609 [Tanacetum coccineum]